MFRTDDGTDVMKLYFECFDRRELLFTCSKQLLDEDFVISRIIKVEIGVISRSQRPRLITLTETLIILDIDLPTYTANTTQRSWEVS